MYDLIIVGAGPAGLTAAIYAARANKKVLIFESNIHGGQIIYAKRIDNYPGLPGIAGYEFANTLYKQVTNLGVTIKYETVIKIKEDKTVVTKNDKYNAKAIILATGASKKKLKLENEEKFIGKGISYCATCDGNFYKGKNVAVVGTGSSALEDAIYLSDIASNVYVINSGDTFENTNLFNILISKKNIKFCFNSNVVALDGNNILESIDIKNKDEEINKLDINALFIAIGSSPQNDIFKDVINIDEKGYIISKDGVHTNVNGIYVAGDARKKELRQLVTAVSDGAVAAMTAIKEMEDM